MTLQFNTHTRIESWFTRQHLPTCSKASQLWEVCLPSWRLATSCTLSTRDSLKRTLKSMRSLKIRSKSNSACRKHNNNKMSVKSTKTSFSWRDRALGQSVSASNHCVMMLPLSPKRSCRLKGKLNRLCLSWRSPSGINPSSATKVSSKLSITICSSKDASATWGKKVPHFLWVSTLSSLAFQMSLRTLWTR